MNLVRHSNLAAFTEHVTPWLLDRECENCLQLGILGAPPDDIAADGLLPLLFSIEDEHQIVGVGLQLHSFGFSVSRMEPEAAKLLAERLIELRWPPAGMVGPVDVADTISNQLCGKNGWTGRVHLALRVFQLTRVLPPSPVNGRIISATMDHLDVVTRWTDAFGREIQEPHDDPAAHARRRIEKNQFFLWQEGGHFRAIAGISGPTPNGIRINHVYTPPEFRRRGYASNLVAALSQRMLDSGRRFCFLFTDLANPTSNKIYQQIGYEPVSDFRHWRFERCAS